MNIDISNAHCGPRIQFPDHAWLRVVLVPRNCLRPLSETKKRAAGVRAIVGRSPGCAGPSSLIPRGVWFPLPPRLWRSVSPWASFEMMGRMMERRRAESERVYAPPPGDGKRHTNARLSNREGGAASLSHASLSLSQRACASVSRSSARVTSLERTVRAPSGGMERVAPANEAQKENPRPRAHPTVTSTVRESVRAFACAGWIASRPRVRVHEVPRGMWGPARVVVYSSNSIHPAPAIERRSHARSRQRPPFCLPACVHDSSPPFYALLLLLLLLLRWEMRAAPRPTPLPRQAIDDRRLAATRIAILFTGEREIRLVVASATSGVLYA